MPAIDADDSEPREIDKPRLVRKLDDYATSTRASQAVQMNHLKLVEAQIAVATDLQDLVGNDVVIFYKGRAFVPYTNGNRVGYQILPVYDLDAALIGERLSEGDHPL